MINFNWVFGNIKVGKKEMAIITLVWFVLSAITVLSEVLRGASSVNNYFVYKGVFEHLMKNQNLYLAYPKEYVDLNHYGPVFGLLIAPFAVMPWFIGCFFWGFLNACFLFFAISKLNLNRKATLTILLISLVELMTSLHNVQYNPFIAALIILAFVFVREEKEWLAALVIAFGFLTKLYPIVGVLFIFFSDHKIKFILWGLFWMVVFTILPVIITSPHFLYQTYFDWYQSLVEKTNENMQCSMHAGMQDISVMGIIRRVSKVYDFSAIWVVIPAFLFISIPLTRIRLYKNATYQFLYLACLLISTVIFSSSAESPTYIIAMSGVGIWWIVQEHPYSALNKFALIFAIILTSLSPTDLIPGYIKVHYVVAYSLKALPCFVVWCIIIYQLFFKELETTSFESKRILS